MKNKLFITLLAGVFVLGLFSLAQAGKPTRSEGFYCSFDGKNFNIKDDCDEYCDQEEGVFCSEALIYVGNGYPSGKHYNLNIKAHKNFSCPLEEEVMKGYCPDPEPKVFDSLAECNYANPLAEPPVNNCIADCFEVFGNVIHFPASNKMDSYSILMESGRVNPKGKPDKFDNSETNYPDLLEVTDWCMSGGDTNATFRLPADLDGYAVYARLVGSPNGDPVFDFTDPNLDYVEDANQDILNLGFITPEGGVFNQKGEYIYPVTRTKGKKVSTATNITPMFMWSGDICTFGDYGGIETPKCCSGDDLTITEDPEGVIEVTGEFLGVYDSCVDPSNTPHCCIDNQPVDGDGVYDSCVPATGDTPTCLPDYVLTGCAYADDPFTTTGDADPIGPIPEDAYCIKYGDDPDTSEVDGDPVWVFNIAEFVGVMFNIVSDHGHEASLLKIRFYPLPLNEGDPE